MMMRTANFSACRKYRYSLKRVWNRQSPFVLFIGLNPSTADEINDDPTLTRCMDYAKRWGYGGVCVANLFAYRATKPTDMLRVNDPIGIDNNSWLKKLSKAAGLTVVAWGNHGTIWIDLTMFKTFSKICIALNTIFRVNLATPFI